MNKVQTLCGKFHTRSNISKHRKTCKICSANNLQAMLLQHRDDQVQNLQRQIDELSKKPTVINTVNVQVNILNFSEDAQLSIADVHKILLPPGESVPKYVKMKHFTHAGGNVRIPNRRDNKIQVFHDGKWLYRDRKSTINEIKSTSLEEMAEKYRALENDEFKKWFEDYIQSSKALQEELNKIIDLEILNNQKE